ncbi:MAG: efflux RND transporter permease subunit [Deltaproteobacteria bacterium]|nr:efflux RND transporter permease subunit [Deltaproteobacteria bacterium]
MIRFFTEHPTAANLLMIVFLILGVYSLPDLKRETFPPFIPSKVQVRVIYPGATAEEVEEAIVQRLEDALIGIENVERSLAKATEGLGYVVLEMDEDSGDIKELLDDVRTEVAAITNFPEDARDPVITEMSKSSRIVSIAVTGPMSTTDLKDYSEGLRRKLQRLPDVSIVKISGFSDRQIRIQLSSEMLLKFGLSINDVANKITKQSINRPIGSIETLDKEILLRFNDQRRLPGDYEDIIVLGGRKGAEIRLGDIATIEERFEKDEIKTLFNNERASIIEVERTDAEDGVEVVNAVKKFVKEQQPKAPPGVKLTITGDLASIIQDRLDLLIKNGWQGLLLVFFSLWVFFSFRLSFWVTMGLPVSFAGAVFVMHQFGYSLNMMTTMALIITLGLLMDDAIVIAENIAAHLQRGKTALKAAINGVMEVQTGIISSFLTTACVFVPLMFIEGRMGRVLKVIPFVLIAVLAVSLVEAFFILPSHLSHAMKNHKLDNPGKLKSALNNGIEWFRDVVLGKTVDAAVRYRYLTVGIIIAVFVISLGTFSAGWLKFISFPEVEDDSIQARIYLPPGTPLSHTEKVVKQVLVGLSKTDEYYTPMQKGQKKLVEQIQVSFATNSDVSENGANLATVYVDLLSSEYRKGNVDDILTRLRMDTGKVTDVISLKFAKPSMGPAGNAIEIELRGDQFKKLELVSAEIEDYLYQFDGVYDLYSDLRLGKQEIQMKLKKGASVLGMDASAIASQLSTAFQGLTTMEVQVGRNSYEIDVRLEPKSKNSLSDLDQFKIVGSKGEKIPLENIVSLKNNRGYSTINHVDGKRTITLYGSINAQVANGNEIMNRFKKEFIPNLKARHPDVEVFLGGASKNTSQTGASMARSLVIGLLGIFILLSFQFRSYTEPIVVMLAIPFSLIGVIWGHIALGLPMSMLSMLGYISLAGIVVNDSILLVEFIKNGRSSGKTIVEASCNASRMRFRAILLTSVTTILGLLPLLSETSLQAQLLVPIAASIAFGMLASTILVLIGIPSFYSILGDIGLIKEVAKK